MLRSATLPLASQQPPPRLPPPLQVYPDRVAALPPQQFGRLLQTLEIGVASNDREALLSSLEAVASLGRHDYELRKGGRPGVQAAGAQLHWL